MSHTSTVKSIKIQSITALRAAIKELNETGVVCSLVENAIPRAFYPNQPGMGAAQFVIQLGKSPYDIGLYKQADGSYEARTDFFAGHIERLLGSKAKSAETQEQAKLGRLFQTYGIAAATEAARKQGHMVKRSTKADGAVILEITGPGL